ncbi:hypothetical protein Prum_015260 [Phytohabitans rumicis]|uniref:Uncharacterized protein n=1 Tax=Phytohabitans rumicis TaxID=1076125 RepID=A0A6V8KVL7_9ACTN|nr:hypothetical protein Prum_015260 [Phytohabitans rumicis]
MDGPAADDPGPGGLIDKGTKGKRARTVPIIEEIRPMVAARLDALTDPQGRLFTGPRADGSARRYCETRPTGTTW